MQLVVSVVLCLWSGGCTVALQTASEQCTEDADCAALGADFEGTVCIDEVCQTPPDSRWSCVGKVEQPPAGTMFTASILLNDLLAAKPVTDATVKLCKKLDALCAVPVDTFTPDASGIVEVEVDSSFRGYFDIQAPGFVNVLYFVDTGGVTGTLTVSMFSPETSNALNQSITSDIDPEAGFVNISMVDCNQERASGVHFEIAPGDGVTPFYAVGSAASGTATETDATGNGGFINVTPGTVTVSADLAATGEMLGAETTLIRKGTLTFQPLRPTPAE